MANEWLRKFKVAFINEDIEELASLISKFDINSFKNLDELNEASSLILQTTTLFKNKKIHLENEFLKLQNAKNYAK